MPSIAKKVLAHALAALAVLLLLTVAPGARAADAYDWSGTLSVDRTGSGPEAGSHIAFTGPVAPSAWRGIASFAPTMSGWSLWSQHVGEWCRATQELRPGDAADTSVPFHVEPGAPGPDGAPGPPRLVAPVGGSWSFPRHSEQCLAFDGGELQRIPDDSDGLISLEDVFACRSEGFPYPEPPSLPFATSGYLPPALPQAQVLGDGRVRIVGSVSTECDHKSVDEVSSRLTVAVDLTGTPAGDGPGGEIIGVNHALQVEVNAPQHGSVVGAGGVIACGRGQAACSATIPGGADVRLAALPSEVGRLILWSGCDRVMGQSCLLSMTTPRTVRAWFGYDFLGQWEPPPDGLFDPARKAEIAGDGARSARNGAVGCALTAGLIGTGGSGGVIVAGTAGVATRWTALVEKALEETVGNCLTGLGGTIYNGVLLKVDPPDPDWRRVALAQPFASRRSAPCRVSGCAAVTRALRTLGAAGARVAALQEAIAVAANRYGNAVGAGDREAQALHQATMRATSGMLAAAEVRRGRAAAGLARALGAAGIRRIVTPRAAVARALRAQAAGRGVPSALTARLLRRHLITRAREVRALVRATAPRRAGAIDGLSSLRRAAPTRRMRAAAAALTLGDVGRLLHAAHRDAATPDAAAARHQEQLAMALRCDAGAPPALGRLAGLVGAAGGIRGEAGRLVAAAAREVTRHDLRADEACRG